MPAIEAGAPRKREIAQHAQPSSSTAWDSTVSAAKASIPSPLPSNNPRSPRRQHGSRAPGRPTRPAAGICISTRLRREPICSAPPGCTFVEHGRSASEATITVHVGNIGLLLEVPTGCSQRREHASTRVHQARIILESASRALSDVGRSNVDGLRQFESRRVRLSIRPQAPDNFRLRRVHLRAAARARHPEIKAARGGWSSAPTAGSPCRRGSTSAAHRSSDHAARWTIGTTRLVRAQQVAPERLSTPSSPGLMRVDGVDLRLGVRRQRFTRHRILRHRRTNDKPRARRGDNGSRVAFSRRSTARRGATRRLTDASRCSTQFLVSQPEDRELAHGRANGQRASDRELQRHADAREAIEAMRAASRWSSLRSPCAVISLRWSGDSRLTNWRRRSGIALLLGCWRSRSTRRSISTASTRRGALKQANLIPCRGRTPAAFQEFAVRGPAAGCPSPAGPPTAPGRRDDRLSSCDSDGFGHEPGQQPHRGRSPGRRFAWRKPMPGDGA